MGADSVRRGAEEGGWYLSGLFMETSGVDGSWWGSWSAASTWGCDVLGAGAVVFGLCFLNGGGFERE